MTRITWTAVLALMLVFPEIAHAQGAPSAGAVTLPESELRTFHASSTQSDYRIYVALPEGYLPSDTIHYPVVYILDGDWLFAMLVQA
jgi:enterochelin esterase-like enzyme